MNELKGNEFLFQIEDPNNPDTFLDLGGLKTNSISWASEAVEITKKGSNGWRQIMNSCGVNSLDFSGEGFAEKSVTLKHLLTAMKNKSFLNCRLSMKLGDENVLQITVNSKITSLEFTGENDQGVPYTVSAMQAEEPDVQIF